MMLGSTGAAGYGAMLPRNRADGADAGCADENYASVFLKFTNEVIAKCTPDIEYDARIRVRLDALKSVYQSDFAAVVAVARDTGYADVIFSTAGPDGFERLPSFDLRPYILSDYLDALEEDVPACFLRKDDGTFEPCERAKAPSSGFMAMCLPIIKTNQRVWLVVNLRPRRFSEYTLSLTLGADAIKTELSKRIMLEEIAGGDTPFLQTKMPENSVYVRMLGRFTVRAPGGKIDCYDIGGRQCTVLLAKLLLNPRRLVSSREILDMLAPLSVASNPHNALKSTIFRIRKAFRPILHGDADVIVARHGSYSLNQDLQFILDASQFELFSSIAGKRGVAAIERMALLEYAIKQYHGDLLPGLEGDLSILGQITYYRLLFEKSLEQYLNLLIETGQYQRIFKTIAHISEQRYSNPNIYRTLIDALIEMDYRDMAVAYLAGMKGILPRQVFRAIEAELSVKHGPALGTAM